MKMTLVSVTSSWLCATGVAVISSYCIMTHSHGTAADQKKAARVNELNRSGVNYFTVRPRVKEDDVNRKVVY